MGLSMVSVAFALFGDRKIEFFFVSRDNEERRTVLSHARMQQYRFIHQILYIVLHMLIYLAGILLT